MKQTVKIRLGAGDAQGVEVNGTRILCCQALKFEAAVDGPMFVTLTFVATDAEIELEGEADKLIVVMNGEVE